MNVHYFFISNRTQYESDVQSTKDDFDEILSGMSLDMQNHWNGHLHFINTKTSDLDNWLQNALSGKYALAIDQSQKIRQIGYLGNPATFSGESISIEKYPVPRDPKLSVAGSLQLELFPLQTPHSSTTASPPHTPRQSYPPHIQLPAQLKQSSGYSHDPSS